MDLERLEKQIEFIVEIDQLKSVLRRTRLIKEDRLENSAEHSWDIAMMAFILHEHANEPVELLRVLKMLLIHDIVEIDAGDTFLYDVKGAEDKREREEAAADRIFGMLPEDQASELRALWEEFEARDTPEAKFAASVDRLTGMLHNHRTQGGTWQQHNVPANFVRKFNAHIQNGSEALSVVARGLIDDAIKKGWLRDE